MQCVKSFINTAYNGGHENEFTIFTSTGRFTTAFHHLLGCQCGEELK
jgi:hypothetical protein